MTNRVEDPQEIQAQYTLTPGATANATTVRTNAAAGANVKDGLSFEAESVIVTNLSGQWYYVEAANDWVPPYWVGRVLRLLASTRQANILALTPGGFTSNPQTGEQCFVVYTTRVLQPDEGTPLVNATGVLPGSGTEAPGDGITPRTGPDPLAVTSFPEVFNPDAVVWDRQRGPSATQGAGAITHTGLPYSLPVGFLSADTYRIIQAFVGADGMAANGNYLGVMALAGLFNGTNLDRARTPIVFKTVTTLATGDTALWTPAAGKKFRLMGYVIYLTADAVAAAGADLEVLLRDATSAIGVGWSAFVPAAAGAVIGTDNTSGPVQLGNGKLSAVANNVLNVNLSFALTGGEVRAVAWGTEE